MQLLLWVPLLTTAIWDARKHEVAVWLILIDVGFLLSQLHSLTSFIAGVLVAVLIFLLKPKIGAADQILLPVLVAAFGFWPIIGLFLGESYKTVYNKSHFPLLPWLIFPCLISAIVGFTHLHH